MGRIAKALGTLGLVLLLGTAGCKDQTARDMAKQVADSLVAYGVRNGVWANVVQTAVCNLDKSIWDPTVNPGPGTPPTTHIQPADPVNSTALCPPGQPERAVPPDDPEDPFQ